MRRTLCRAGLTVVFVSALGASVPASAAAASGTLHRAVVSGIARGDEGGGIITPHDSTVLIAGRAARPERGHDVLLRARSAVDGSRLWLRRYAGPATADDWVFGSAVTPDGRTFFVVGGCARARGAPGRAYGGSSSPVGEAA